MPEDTGNSKERILTGGGHGKQGQGNELVKKGHEKKKGQGCSLMKGMEKWQGLDNKLLVEKSKKTNAATFNGGTGGPGKKGTRAKTLVSSPS